jgi:bromodomain-containing factor 1
VSARPKREIHPPPPKDIDYTEQAPKRAAPGKVGKNGKRKKDDGTLEQLRFCLRVVNDLYKKQYATFAQFFYDPVSEEYAPNYYKIIKRPMDLSTLKRNLDQKAYQDANAFYDDFQLMISNCVRFNPVATAVYIAGQDLAKAFNEKWRALPPLRSPPPSSDEEDEDEGNPNTIESLEAQLAGIRETIDALKTKKVKGKAEGKMSAMRQNSASYSKAAPSSSMARRPAATKKSGSSSKKAANGAQRRTLDADAQLTFEEKKELSETIQNLESPALDEVIQIIHDGVPDIGDVSAIFLYFLFRVH